ncbi:fluoride efflux transporter CrcB [Prevotella aurantiaca]
MILVGLGSFFGGMIRYSVSYLIGRYIISPFPLATFIVNVLGCLIIGFVSGLPVFASLGTSNRLLLTAGLCGGFTTFSTFISENVMFLKDGRPTTALLYIFGSIVAGFLAVVIGQLIAKLF